MTGVRCQTHLDVGCGAATTATLGKPLWGNPARPHNAGPAHKSNQGTGSDLHCVRCAFGRSDPLVADPFCGASVARCEGQPFRARAVAAALDPPSPASPGSGVGQLARRRSTAAMNSAETMMITNPALVLNTPCEWPV